MNDAEALQRQEKEGLDTSKEPLTYSYPTEAAGHARSTLLIQCC